jgi:BlaI family transcriptional regulator, penicillinase repressor
MAFKKTGDALTLLEMEIMKALWDLGPSNVQGVQAHIAGERPLAYTTVQTMLNLLLKKKKVKRKLKEKAYIYQAAVTRQSALSKAIGDLVDRLFGGSVDGLVMNLMESRRLNAEDLDRLKKTLEAGHDRT